MEEIAMTKKPLEPAANRQRRLHRRQTILRYSLLPLAVLVLVGLKLISMNVMFMLGENSYRHSDYSGASSSFGLLGLVNFVEPYKAHFAKGTAELQAKRYEDAQRDLQAALDAGVPKAQECQVRLNLILAWARMGDDQMEQKQYDAAIISYDHVKSIVDGRDCGLKVENQGGSGGKASDDTKQADQKMQQQRRDAEGKQNQAKQAKNGDPSDQSQPSEGGKQSNDQQPSQDQLQQLEKQQKQNTAKANQDEAERQSLDQSELDYNGRHW